MDFSRPADHRKAYDRFDPNGLHALARAFLKYAALLRATGHRQQAEKAIGEAAYILRRVGAGLD